MINSVDGYLRELKDELKNCDRATIQDALSDAEEYLRNTVENLREANPGISEETVFTKIMEQYGTPAEIAAAYRKIEVRTSPVLNARANREKGNYLSRFFGVVIDPRSWGALLYLLFTLVTGIVYFTWTVTGISLSLGLLVLAIGIPVAGIFILSIRGLALLEGRMVEALLGIRMPHRQLFAKKDQGLWGKFKSLITDAYTWFSMAYMILMLPLGIIYFTVFVTLIALSLGLVALPILEFGFGLPVFTINNSLYYLSGWFMPIAVIAGILLFFLTLHLAKIIGNLQGRLAKVMLVKETK